MKEPLVSIIMPAYNVEKTIGVIVKSVLGQPYKNIELIVVDDGSKDKTGKILSKFDDKRLRVVKRANGGVSVARNTGIAHANGEYVMFFDADDDIGPGIIQEMVDAMRKNKVDIVVCGNWMNGKQVLPPYTGKVKQDLKSHILLSIARGGLLYSPWNKIYKMDIIRRGRIEFVPKVRFGEDLMFNLAYFEHVKNMYYLKKALYKYNYSYQGASFTSAALKSDRKTMYGAIKYFAGKSRSLSMIVAMCLIKLRWGLSVQKAKIKKRLHG